jgi:hypothetical protein
MWKTALFAASVALAATFLACAPTPGTGTGGTGKITVVQFTFDELKPKSTHIPPDGNISWVNLSPDSRAFVVFPASIAESFTCGENLEPYFRKIEGGFQSLPLTSFESNTVQLPCSLPPGSYEYEVAITNAGGMQLDPSAPPQKLLGTIVVE